MSRRASSDCHVPVIYTEFLQALLASSTFRIQEGLDVNKLGLETPSPHRSQPTTPTVIPPTPTPVAGPSRAPPSPASSSNELFYDTEDPEPTAQRRSMYRSPGTSSSPDLATLLRKAKERGGVGVPKSNRDRRRPDDPPPLPNQITSIAYASNAPRSKNRLQRTTTNGDGDKVRSRNTTF